MRPGTVRVGDLVSFIGSYPCGPGGAVVEGLLLRGRVADVCHTSGYWRAPTVWTQHGAVEVREEKLTLEDRPAAGVRS